MNSTFQLMVLIYLAIGLLIFGNFAYSEGKRKELSFWIILILGIFPIFLWPFYWPFFMPRK